MMIKTVRQGWPYMETWERVVLVVLFPLWVLVWYALWGYLSVTTIYRKMRRS